HALELALLRRRKMVEVGAHAVDPKAYGGCCKAGIGRRACPPAAEFRLEPSLPPAEPLAIQLLAELVDRLGHLSLDGLHVRAEQPGNLAVGVTIGSVKFEDLPLNPGQVREGFL